MKRQNKLANPDVNRLAKTSLTLAKRRKDGAPARKKPQVHTPDLSYKRRSLHLKQRRGVIKAGPLFSLAGGVGRDAG